jgi:hypothetical protein
LTCNYAHWNQTAHTVVENLRNDHPRSIASSVAHGSAELQLQWDEGAHIAVKEIIPIAIVAVLWGHHWKGSRVLAHCDNPAV